MWEKENEIGNVEYKLQLIDKNSERLETLASQMRFRCEEGNGECLYVLGIKDDGEMVGLSREEFDKTITTLKSVAGRNNYSVSVLYEHKVDGGGVVYEVLVREINADKYLDIKIAIAGNVDSGKSSFLSVLTNGKLDDGRGSARLSVFNFPHEVKTGRTSSIGHHILGFDVNGNITNFNSKSNSSWGDVISRNQIKNTWADIVKKSCKIITFLDLAGHEKYLKTTILGLSSSYPDLCFVIVGANKGISRMTTEHIFLCISLGIPFVIIVTKVDMVQNKDNVFNETMDSINRLVKCPGIRRMPLKISSDEDIIIAAKNIYSETIVPIFFVSNVTGDGLHNVRKFANILQRRHHQSSSDNVEFIIDNVWSVSGIGTVVGGYLLSGNVNVGDGLYMGPMNGKYENVTVRSIHVKRIPVQTTHSGSYVCFGLKKINHARIRRGSVIVSDKVQHVFCKSFTANVKVLKSHSTTIGVGYEPVVFVNSIKQTARIVDISNITNYRNSNIVEPSTTPILRTGDIADVKFEFKYNPEFVKVGMKVLLCENITKIVGTIINVE